MTHFLGFLGLFSCKRGGGGSNNWCPILGWRPRAINDTLGKPLSPSSLLGFCFQERQTNGLERREEEGKTTKRRPPLSHPRHKHRTEPSLFSLSISVSGGTRDMRIHCCLLQRTLCKSRQCRNKSKATFPYLDRV